MSKALTTAQIDNMSDICARHRFIYTANTQFISILVILEYTYLNDKRQSFRVSATSKNRLMLNPDKVAEIASMLVIPSPRGYPVPTLIQMFKNLQTDTGVAARRQTLYFFRRKPYVY